MNRSTVIEQLKSEIINITFTKVDGSTRNMKATLSENEIPSASSGSTTKKSPETSQAVWDTEVNGWRSFKWDSIKEVNGVATPNGVSIKG
ncbi:SH3 beta-barrel fold-containing protein [bacterium]|jgi:hypothetical protein|nr:SH3 beta-barrel fold-containing protein [bacterium]